MAPMFDHEPCGRCGGSGQYSWCQMHGTKCFKCGGSGLALTKRGAAAQQWYRDGLTILAGDVLVGQRVKDPVTGATFTVASIKVQDWGTARHKDGTTTPIKGVLFTTMGCKQEGYSAGIKLVLQPGPEERQRRKAEALKYQDSLTKAGKPRKVRS